MATPSADQANFSQDSHNRAGLNVFILSMVVSIGFFILLVAFHHGVDLKEVTEKSAAPAAGAAVTPSAAAAPAGEPAAPATK